MTREVAVDTAAREAKLFGLTMAVYRMPAWPAAVYGVRAAGKLPSEAEKLEVFQPPVLAAPVSLCEIAETSKSPNKTARTSCLPVAGQGSLF